jgi:G:T-mismatch repair DNA endonuclease (very short patch repair protein)
MIFSIILACVFALAALLMYASCCAAANADRMSEEYWLKKISENENLKNRKN